MSGVTHRKPYFIALAIAAVGGPGALANPPPSAQLHPGGVFHPGNPNVAACATGFTASPATINGSNAYGQSYTCTGPAIVCSPHFSPQKVVAGTIPGGQGQFGQTIYGSPVAIKNGRMVYTCAEPQPPPR